MSAAPSWADVLALVAQLDGSGLEEAEVVADGVSVRVSRGPGALWGGAGAGGSSSAVGSPTAGSPTAGSPTAAAPAGADRAAAASAADARPVGPAPGAGLAEVTAPLLGVVYLRPAPGRPPFVAVGDVVEESTTVAIVEVMKMMNTVSAGVAGRVVEVVVQEGSTVEHGAVLLRVEPA